MKAEIKFEKDEVCNFCLENKPFLVRINNLRFCKDCIDIIYKKSEGIE